MQARARAIIVSLSVALPALVLAGQASTGCIFTSADDCLLTLGFGCKGTSASSSGTGGPSGTGGTAGSGGTGGTTTSSMSSSGTGGAPACTAADTSKCAHVPAGPCASLGAVTCTKGKCGVSYMTVPAPSQIYGDCKTTYCGADGMTTDVPDDTDVYRNGNPCTIEGCLDGGVPSSMTQNTGSSCNGGTGYCEVDPQSLAVTCLQCNPNVPTTCGGTPSTPKCPFGTCVSAQCTNGLLDPGETDKDCGGPCPKCAANKNCLGPQDCLSGVCPSGKCVPATCPDNVQNNDETDIDCGGTLQGCARCPDTRKCLLPSDCVSGVCKPSPVQGMPNTCQVPSCTDGVQNGDEAGVDCGGPVSMCPACP